MWLDLPFEKGDAHSALGDVEVTRQLLIRIQEDFGYSIEDMVQLAAAPLKIASMPFGKHRGVALTELPKQYVGWALKNLDLDPDLRNCLEAI